jgi:hypothetical protein
MASANGFRNALPDQAPARRTLPFRGNHDRFSISPQRWIVL